ncbi:MAG: DUF1524 domain-containing protein [Planctomycetota bacterium]|nr:DUF1524 domain-containing protein [Planctomycetota bacterium]
MTKYKDADRNQLANCMLLTQQENGAGGKSDTLPNEWFAGKDAAYLELHMIPHDPNLWKLERFEDFVAERKKLIRSQFAYLLAIPVKAAADTA